MSKFWSSDLETGYYDKILVKGLKRNRGIQANWHNITFDRIKKYLLQDKQHLDYACGSGSLIGLYSSANSIGIDISDKQIEYASNKYGDRGKFYTLEEFESDNQEEKYDIITVLGLIEFLNQNDNLEVLNKLHKALRPSGTLILTTPNFNTTMYILDVVINFFGPVSYKNEHLSKFNERKLRNLIENSNFDQIEIDKFINFPVFLSFLSIKFGLNLNKIIAKITQKKMGYLLFAKLTK
tara:strand:- start:1443 stop:2156 length:714 start_codon:yes stop_codon:yes gene_type:complete